MTDTTETTQTTDQTTDPEQVDPTTPEAPEGKANKEAAKYRVQLRETETQRDRLAAVVATYQRTEAETLAKSAGLTTGADLFTAGVDLAQLLDDNGHIDPTKVQAAAEAVLEQHPNWRKGIPDFGGGDRGTDVPTGNNKVTWSDAFKDASR